MKEPLRFSQSFAGPGAPDPVELGSWQRMESGGGRVTQTETGLRFITRDTTAHTYTNAQIDDYQGHSRGEFSWQPPLTLTVRARFSHAAAATGEAGGLRGTAGFGFWNDPFLMTGRRVPALPRVIWFFYSSPPSDMPLHLGTPGSGWKAATLDALHPSAVLLALSAPFAVPLMNLRAFYKTAWPAAQRTLRISEAIVTAAMTDWHSYIIEWDVERARFQVDGLPVLDCDTPPRGPLGLVIWLDNQYLIATPWGRLRHGVLATPGEQWLELEHVTIG